MTESPKKILIVEDEPSLRNLLQSRLMEEGFFVFAAENGSEGLGTALAQKPDLIVLDLIMPKMDGLEMLKQLRAQPWGKDTKVIVLTNLSEEKVVGDVLQQGTYDFLVKADWKLEDIIKRVKERLVS